MTMLRALVLVLLLPLCGAAAAREAASVSADPVVDARVMRLADKLRCLVCQNQTLADSNAELAVDLRRQLYEQVKAGRSDDEILDYLVQRYGDFVLYQPPFKASTVVLWIGPFVLLAAALALLYFMLARRRRALAGGELSEEERRRVERMLGAEGATRGEDAR